MTTHDPAPRGPAYRGILRRLNAGIKAGRQEAAAARAEQEKISRQYDEQHPSDLGKKIGRTIERAAPVTRPLARSAKRAGRTLARQSKIAIQRYAAAQERAQKAARKKAPSSRPRTPLDGLEDMLITSPASPATRKKKKRRKNPDNDPLGLGSGFRLL